MSIYDFDKSLPASCYNTSVTAKSQILLHHTAGGSNPLNVVAGWASQTAHVAAHNVIGGRGEYDGKIVKAIDSKFWPWHLGIKAASDPTHKPHGYYDSRSIGIEICAWGPLTKNSAGEYISYVGTKVPADQVLDLGQEWRGYQYYHDYSDAQIEALGRLITYHCKNNGIQLDAGRVFTEADFETDIEAFADKAIAFHVNYRSDKFDCIPSPKLIDLLNQLHTVQDQ